MTERDREAREWIAQHVTGGTIEQGRTTPRGTTMLVYDATDAEIEALQAHLAALGPLPPPDFADLDADNTASLFGGTLARLTIYSRNAVSWLASRSWRRESQKQDVAALKAAKAALDPATVEKAASDLATVLEKQVGRDNPAIIVTHVACGHSKRPDCFACHLAQAVAGKLGLAFQKVFGDRFVSGVSHPKEFQKLAPIEIVEKPSRPTVLVIDDVATSGWHMEEALTVLRKAGSLAIGAVWIAGKVE